MTEQMCMLEDFYSTEWDNPVQIEHHPLNILLPEAESASPTTASHTFFHPSDVPPISSSRRSTLDHIVSRLSASTLPGNEYAIACLHDKYRRNLAKSTIYHTGICLLDFLIFYTTSSRRPIEEITRQDIAAYIEHEQDRGLEVNSVKGKLANVYAFLQFLVDNTILPAGILNKKFRIKSPDTLPRAIPHEDIKQLLAVIDNQRDRALILLLLHTGMRIGELLNVKITDILLPERKIMLYIGAKNYEGRVVYYSDEADKALRQWLTIRKRENELLFYGRSNKKLCYVSAWLVMRKYLLKSGLAYKGYSLHSLRHTFATNMLNAGLRIEVLQQLLGHKCIEMTLRYARMSNLTRENEYFRAMAKIEKGGNNEHHRVNSNLQAVFEEKKLL